MNTNIRGRGGLDTRRVQSGKISRQQPGLSLNRVALAMAGLFASASVLAAHIDPAEQAQLESEAKRAGVVRVMVSLDNSVTLEAMHNNLSAVRSAMEQKAKTLLAELGDDAWDVAQWQNGVGQMGVYVNAAGLKKLAASKHAVAFMPDSTHAYRIRVSDSDGSLDEVEQAIDAKGYADVEVLLNVEGDYDIDKNGNSLFRPSAAMLSEITDKLRAIGARKFAGKLRNLIAPAANPAKPEPTFKVRLDRKAFYALREDTDVRAIRPVGFKDKRQAQWPTEVLERAKAEGSADVIISLRGGSAYSPKGGFMSAAAWKAQGKAHGRVFDDILLSAGTTRASLPIVDHEGIGSMQVKLPYKALARLYANADARVLGIGLNKPVATLALASSTAQINMPAAWNAGFKAKGQNIIIIDNGVRKDHEMFKGDGGVSRVTFEACFGTDILGEVSSMCPAKDSSGNSPLNYPGSAAPWSEANCKAVEEVRDPRTGKVIRVDPACSHGTHVAGIAAGRYSPNDSSIPQGVAPEASIIAVQAASRLPSGGQTFYSADIYSALYEVQKAVATSTSENNPYVVNISLASRGAEVYEKGLSPAEPESPDPAVRMKSCSRPLAAYSADLRPVVAYLSSKGIPVVVPTGNGKDGVGYKNGISWPACIPLTVKVAAVPNDGVGKSLSSYSNISNPDNYTGPFFLAPGGEPWGQILSAARASNVALVGMDGTSQAAPHVAGFYAAYKAAVPNTNLANATAWIAGGSGSIPVVINLPGVGSKQFRRISVN